MNADDRREAVAALTRQGVTANAIATHLHITTRTVSRDRAATGCGAQPAAPKPKPPSGTPPRRNPHIGAWTSHGDTHWMVDAACRADPTWTQDTKPSDVVLRALFAVCHTCPVIRQCAALALTLHPHGAVMAAVWLPGKHSPIACRDARKVLHARKTMGMT